MKKILSIVLSFLMLLVLVGSPSGVILADDTGDEDPIVDVLTEGTGEKPVGLDKAIPDNDVVISILHTNDIHATLLDGSGVVGFIKLATYIAQFKSANPNAIIVDAGDFSQGTVYNNLTKGALMFEAIDGLYDIATIGNHEYDWGRDNLLQNLEKAPGVTFLNANIVWKKAKVLNAKGKTVTKKNVPMFQENTIIDVEGVKVGFFGLASNDFKNKVATSVWKNSKILDPVKTAKKQVKALKKQGADIIVAITHMGTVADGGVTSIKLRSKVAGIDVIIDGHSHTSCPTTGNMCQTPARGTLIASNEGNLAGGIGIVQITVSNSGYTVKEEKVKAADLAALSLTADPTVDGIYSTVEAANVGFMSTVVATATNDLTALRWTITTPPPAGYSNNIDDSVRAGESIMGNVIADAYRYVTKAQIGIVNGGGVRASIPAGSITNADLLTVQPYGNNVVVLKMTGKVLKKMLEHSVSTYPAESGGFLQVSGMSFTFNPAKKAGSRVSNILIGGKKWSAKKKYTVAIPDFTAQGGDGFTMLKKLKPLQTYGTDYKVVTDYFDSLGGTISMTIEGRIVRK